MARSEELVVGAGGSAPEADRLRLLAFDATTTGVLVTDPARPDNPVVAANPAFLAMTGYDLGEVLGRNCRFLQGPGTDPAAVARIRAAVAAGERITETVLNYRKDGTPFWCELRISPVRDAAGRPTHFVGVQADATARVEAEAAARRAEGRYRALVEGLPGVVYARGAGPGTPPLYMSPRVEHLLGYPASAWEGDPAFWRGVIHPDDRERVRGAVAAAVAGGGAFLVEYRVGAADGRTVWVRDEARLVAPEDGGEPYWQGVVSDASAEHAADQDRARLAAIVDSADDAILSKDLDGTVRSWNAAAERMYGWRAEEIVGRSVATIVPPERMGELAGILRRTAAGERVERLETSRVTREGDRLDVSLTVSPVRDPAGAVVGASVIARDVTARKRAEAELVAAKEAAEEADRLKTAFLRTMSHELRTPLTAILGYAELLLLEDHLSPQQAADARRITEGAGRLLALVDDVLDLARIQAGGLELEVAEVLLAEVVAEVLADAGGQAGAKGVALVARVPPDLRLRADPLRLRQVLLNLVGNAVKFTEAGTVEVRARGLPGAVEVAVRDTGIGIAPEALPRVFDEFRQADPSTTRRFGGTGLGLAIARRLVELHGGTIAAESRVGEGSVFTVVLPDRSGDPASAGEGA